MLKTIKSLNAVAGISSIINVAVSQCRISRFLMSGKGGIVNKVVL